MILGLLWMISLYGSGALLVHAAHHRMLKANKARKIHHYVVNTNHSQLQIEWSIRSLLLLAWLKGEALHITVIDHGSTDDTIAILNKLTYNSPPNTIHIVHV